MASLVAWRAEPSLEPGKERSSQRHTAWSLPGPCLPLRIAFMDGEEAAWEDLEQVGAAWGAGMCEGPHGRLHVLA